MTESMSWQELSSLGRVEVHSEMTSWASAALSLQWQWCFPVCLPLRRSARKQMFPVHLLSHKYANDTGKRRQLLPEKPSWNLLILFGFLKPAILLLLFKFSSDHHHSENIQICVPVSSQSTETIWRGRAILWPLYICMPMPQMILTKLYICIMYPAKYGDQEC